MNENTHEIVGIRDGKVVYLAKADKESYQDAYDQELDQILVLPAHQSKCYRFGEPVKENGDG